MVLVGGAPLLYQSTPCLRRHMLFLLHGCLHLAFLSSRKDASHTGLGPTVRPQLNLITFSKTLFPNKVTFTGSWCIWIWGGCHPSHYTPSPSLLYSPLPPPRSFPGSVSEPDSSPVTSCRSVTSSSSGQLPPFRTAQPWARRSVASQHGYGSLRMSLHPLWAPVAWSAKWG